MFPPPYFSVRRLLCHTVATQRTSLAICGTGFINEPNCLWIRLDLLVLSVFVWLGQVYSSCDPLICTTIDKIIFAVSARFLLLLLRVNRWDDRVDFVVNTVLYLGCTIIALVGNHIQSLQKVQGLRFLSPDLPSDAAAVRHCLDLIHLLRQSALFCHPPRFGSYKRPSNALVMRRFAHQCGIWVGFVILLLAQLR